MEKIMLFLLGLWLVWFGYTYHKDRDEPYSWFAFIAGIACIFLTFS